VWGEHKLDPLVEVLDRCVERVDVREQLRDHHPVMLDREPTGQRLAQLRDFQAHPGLRQLRTVIKFAQGKSLTQQPPIKVGAS
jgi:hypothetical protein